MRYLKNKVARAHQIYGQFIRECLSDDDSSLVDRKEATSLLPQTQDFDKLASTLPELKSSITKEPKSLSEASEKTTRSQLHLNSNRNIVKNYGRAIASFCLSDVAVFYLDPFAIQENIPLERFKSFVLAAKENIDSISSFRRLLLVTREDHEETAAHKRIFQKMCVVFIKNFSVNWIFSSRLKDKIVHLKCRFKMLRRVMDPEHFTYLKSCH